MPKPRPAEFREDVVAVAGRGDARVSEVAKDFGISESCLRNWIKAADVDDGHRPAAGVDDATEVRELRRRSWLLKQGNEILRRAAAYSSQANLPRNGSTRS